MNMDFKKKIKTSTGLIIVVTAGIILFGGFFVYYFLTESGTKTNTSSIKNQESEVITSMEDDILPNFSDIRKVVDVNGEKWVATNGIIKLKENKIRLYTQKDGLPGSGATDLVVFNNEIWAGFQGGVAKYDAKKDNFSSYLEGEANVSLYVDPVDKKLFASTFKNFFEWNGSSWDKKVGANLPLDSRQIVFTKEYIASTSFPAHPVTIYSRSDKTWQKSAIAEFGDQQGQTLFQANDRVFLYGRSKNYQGCGEDKKEASSIFFEFKNGKWESVPVLNQKFAYYEPIVQKISTPSVKRTFIYNTDPCSGKSESYKKVEVDFSNDNITLSSETDIKYEDVNTLDFDLASTQKALTEATGFSPFKEIKAIDENGNLLVKTSGVALSGSTSGYDMVGFAAIKPTKDGYKEQAILENGKDNPNSMTPILCSRKSGRTFDYLLAQEINEMGGETTKADLYSISNELKATKITPEDSSAIKTISTKVVCKDDTLFWQGNKVIKTLNLRNFSTSEIPITLATDINYFDSNAIVSDVFWLYDPQTKKIAKYVPGAEKTEEVAIDSKVIKLLSNQSKLLGVTESNLWLVSTTESSNATKKVYSLDLNGKLVGNFEISNEVSSLAELDKDHVIGKKRLGTFTANSDGSDVKLVSNSLLPFWGVGTIEGQDFSTSDRISFSFIKDVKFNKIWFTNSGLNFSIDINKLNK